MYMRTQRVLAVGVSAYGICQSIGMALAKLELLETQGYKVKECAE